MRVKVERSKLSKKIFLRGLKQIGVIAQFKDKVFDRQS